MAKVQLRGHPKFKLLRRDLGNIPESYIVGHLECLWQTAYDLIDRDAHFETADEIEAAADWQGKPGDLFNALCERKFLDTCEKGYNIHGLREHAPEYVKKRIVRKETPTADSVGQRRTMADNGRQRTPTQPNPTIPNQTKPNKTIVAASLRFADFWSLYPRIKNVSKKAALKSWQAQNLDSIADEVLAGLRSAIPEFSTDEKYIAHPVTWLNQRRWETAAEQNKETGGAKPATDWSTFK